MSQSINETSLSKNLLSQANEVACQRLVWPVIDDKKLHVYMRRDDLISTHYPGNKFYKLYYNLQAAHASGVNTVVSFGGAYSNHIHALAAVGRECGITTVGIIRGHRPQRLSPTLMDAQEWGMELLFLDREHYKNKDLSPLNSQITERYGSYMLLPEGGDNELGMLGCQVIGQSINNSIHHHLLDDDQTNYTVCCAVGTGTTLSGIITGLPEQVSCIGFSALKGEDTLSEAIQNRLNKAKCKHEGWKLVTDCHHGGYAKTTPELLEFMQQLESQNKHHDLLLEPVYSAKMLWGIEQLALQNYWPEGSVIIAVHGGGLQGRRGFGL